MYNGLEMTGVLKEPNEYTFCNNFANTRGTGLKFWHNMGTYGGHLWYEFQWAAAYIGEVSMLFVCFERVLKGVTEYTFCNNFANTGSTGLKFWHNVGTFSGHLWYELQHTAISTVEVTALFVCFSKCAKFAHVATMGLLGHSRLRNLKFDGWCLFWWEMHQKEQKLLNLWRFRQRSWKESKWSWKNQNVPLFAMLPVFVILM